MLNTKPSEVILKVQIVWLVMSGIALALSLSQEHLYSGNQNAFAFLFPLATSGVGLLSEDWIIVEGATPIPLFGAIITGIHTFVGDWGYYSLYYFLAAIYGVSLFAIVSFTTGLRNNQVRFFTTALAILTIHSAVFGHVVSLAFGSVYIKDILVGGMAAQRLFMPSLEPSIAGVLFITSLALFLGRRPFLAVVTIALACNLHTTYMLPGAYFTSAYMFSMFLRKDRWLTIVGTGTTALLLVLPQVIYAATTFRFADAAVQAQAAHILANEFIPFHTDPFVWFDPGSGLQLLIVLTAGIAFRKNEIGIVILTVTVLAALLSCVKILSGSAELGLLFPWRVSTILVPLSSALLIALIVSKLPLPEKLPPKLHMSTLVILVLWVSTLVAGASYRTFFSPIKYRQNAEIPMMEFVLNNKKSGDLYLIPQGDKWESMNHFRLYTGAPTFVDGKAHPFRADLFLQYWEKRQLALNYYEAFHEGSCKGFLDLSSRFGITHVVTPASWPLNCQDLKTEYEDDYYKVFGPS